MKRVMPVKATIDEVNKVIVKIHPGSIIPLQGKALGGVKVAGSLIPQIIKDYVPEPELVALVGETPEIKELRERIKELDDQAEEAADTVKSAGGSYAQAFNAMGPFNIQAGELRKKIEALLEVDSAIERVICETIGRVELEPEEDVIEWRQEIERVKQMWGGNGVVIMAPFQKAPGMPKQNSVALMVQKDAEKKELTVMAILDTKNGDNQFKSLSGISHEVSALLDNPTVNNGVNYTSLWEGNLSEYKIIVPKPEKVAPVKAEEPKAEELPVAA